MLLQCGHVTVSIMASPEQERKVVCKLFHREPEMQMEFAGREGVKPRDGVPGHEY